MARSGFASSKISACGVAEAATLITCVSVLPVELSAFLSVLPQPVKAAFSYIILLLVQGILEHKITGMVIVPLHKTVLIAIAYGAINLLSMNLYRVAWYYRYAVMILVVGAAAIALRKQMMAVLKMFKKK